MTTSSEADAHPSEQPKLSKKAAKKEEAKLEKLRRRLEASSAVSGAAEEEEEEEEEEDPLATNYGEVPLPDLQSKEEVGEPYTEVGALGEGMQGRSVLVRGRAQAIRAVGKKMAFVVVRERGFTVQCVVTEQEGSVSRQMVKFVASLNRESIVDVRGTLTVPSSPIKGASQQMEIQVHKLHCVSKAFPTLPINLEDAARSEAEIEKALQVMDIVDQLFVAMFDSLNASCKKELEAIGRQYPFEPLKDAGVEIDPLGDLNTEVERKLGQLVLEKYGTEFYILHRYPLAVRPFYTMPCYDNPAYSNSFDVFIRGEEIISGAQRVHVPEFLTKRAEACGIDVKTIETYIDSFRYGAPPHGGFGVGLERVVMLFCGLNNIRKTSLFSRDPLRISP